MGRETILRYFWIAVFAGVAIYFSVFIYQVVQILFTPYGLEYGDGWNAYASDWWGKGGLSYLYPPRTPGLPFFNMPYTPIYYLVVGVFYPLTGPVFWVGRLVSLLSGLGTCLLFYLIVSRLTGGKWWGLVAAVLFFMPPITRAWILWFKVEPLALFFSFLGLYLVIKFSGTRKVLWCVIPLLFAMYTKQTFVSAAVAVGLYFLVTNRKILFQYMGLMVVIGGLAIVVLQLVTNGSFVPSVFTAPAGMPIAWQFSVYLLEAVMLSQWLIVVLAFCAMILLVRKSGWGSCSVLFAFYCLVSLVVLALVSLKAGGWVSYSFEFIPTSIILIPLLAWELGKLRTLPRVDYGFYKEGDRYSINIGSVSIFKYLVPVLLMVQLFMLPSYYSWNKLPDSTESDYAVVLRYVEEVPKDVPIYSEIEELMLWTDRPPMVEPSFYSQMVNVGMVDGSFLLEMVSNKKIGLIIQEWDINSYWKGADGTFPSWISEEVKWLFTMGRLRSTDELAAAVRDNYQLVEHVGKFWIYEPKGVSLE